MFPRRGHPDGAENTQQVQKFPSGGKRLSLVHLMWRCWTAGAPQENTHPISTRHQSSFRSPLSLGAEFSDSGGEVQRHPRGLPSPRVENGVGDHQAHSSALPKKPRAAWDFTRGKL